ncbi:MAG: glycosyltransferase family 4 protein [Bacillus sp. (in: firmicutes)]
MKVLIATVYDIPHAGGLSVHVETLKAGLEALGHEVDILSFSDVFLISRTTMAKGPSTILNMIHKGRGVIWTHRMRYRFLKGLIEKNKHKQYDIINAQDPFATLAALESGIPTVSTVHGYMTYEAISKGTLRENTEEARIMQDIEIKAFKSTRRVITVDTRIKNYVKEIANVDGIPIRNFIDIASFKPNKEKKSELRVKYGIPQNSKVLFCPRRLTKKNGVIYPALAMPEVLREFPDAHLIYAGSGEEMQEIKYIAAHKNIKHAVTLLGAIPHTKVRDYYDLCDIALVPSVHSAGVEEATSISALEAMGCGSPLIACSVGGLKEIINHNVDGLLIEEKNVDALSEAIRTLLREPAAGNQMAKAARAKIEMEYSHLAAASRYLEIYRNALADDEIQIEGVQ